MKILYPTPSELIDDGVRTVMTYLLKINRLYMEEFGVDLVKESPETLARLAHIASDDFGYGYIGQKYTELAGAIDGLSNCSMGNSVVENGGIDDSNISTAFDGAHDETSECLIEVVESFYAAAFPDKTSLAEVQRRSKDGEPLNQTPLDEKFRFAFDHRQVFMPYYAAFVSKYKSEVIAQRFSGVGE